MATLWIVVVVALAATAARAGERCDGNDPTSDLSWAAASGTCGVGVLRRTLNAKTSTESERLRAIDALGYVSRFRLHFEATALLRAAVEKRDGVVRAAALEALRVAGIGMSSKETDMTRYATHADRAVRAAFIDVVTRACDRADRAVIEAGLTNERDAALQEKWRGALASLDACPDDGKRAALSAMIARERSLRALACDEASLVVNDHFIVQNATIDRAHPHVSALRTGATAVEVLPKIEELLRHVSADGLHCKGNQCVHHGRISGWDFAFWFEDTSSRTASACITRIIRTKHEWEPELH